jgi:hypothetical protein
MPRKSIHMDALLQALPGFNSRHWKFAFQIAACDPVLDTESIHDVLRRAVEDQKVAARRKDPHTGRFQYARAKGVRKPYVRKAPRKARVEVRV